MALLPAESALALDKMHDVGEAFALPQVGHDKGAGATHAFGVGFHFGGLRWARHRQKGRGTIEKFGEPSQVLRGCSEQHLVLDSAQAAQPKSIELQDALHVGKSHLDLLAFAARLLERLRISKRANAVSHVLIDVSGHLSAAARRTLCLEFASRTVGPARPIG